MIIAAAIRYTGTSKGFVRGPGFRYWAIGAVLEGDALVHRRGDVELPMLPGSLTIIPPNIAYSNHGYCNQREFWTLFSPKREWRGLMSAYVKNPSLVAIRYRGTPLEHDVEECMMRLDDVHSRQMPDRELWLSNILERLLLLARRLHDDSPVCQIDARIERSIEWIHRQMHRPHTVASLAARACMSESHYAHVFRSCMGTGPGAYVESVRLSRSRDLLLGTSLTIKEIAARVGFGSAFYLSLRFGQAFGVPPSVYRRSGYRR
jgi:AraC-like DNA-binding protein